VFDLEDREPSATSWLDTGAEGALVADRYRLGRRLGAGGTADVFQAQDIHLDRDVAVKVLLNRDQEQTSRFLQETRLLAMLGHPHLVPLYD
jgi:serine/threonine-protein kinase